MNRDLIRKPSFALFLFLSFFGSGLLPKAPGTWASLLTVPFLYFLMTLQVPPLLLTPFILILTVGACMLTEVYQKYHRIHDPSFIVIDEVIGMLITWAISGTNQHWELILCFIFFRFFDIVKVWPASFFDSKIKHGAGTILDDVISGIYAGCLVLLTKKFLYPFFHSF